MKTFRYFISALVALIVSSALLTLQAQEKASVNNYVPEVGQQGKDVVWVPTPQELVNKMLEVAKVTPADYVIDRVR